MVSSSSPTQPRATTRDWLALGVLTLAVVLLAVDGTVLALAVPALSADLAPSATQILWIGDIYSFALAGLLVTMGNVADRIGRKRLLLIGSVGFGLSSVLAAFSSTPEMLIVARAVLGISGATLMPSTLSIVRSIFLDPAQRTRAIAIWSAGATGGAAAGPLIGGALLEHFWWGSVFLINVPVVVVILIAGSFLLPSRAIPRGRRSTSSPRCSRSRRSCRSSTRSSMPSARDRTCRRVSRRRSERLRGCSSCGASAGSRRR